MVRAFLDSIGVRADDIPKQVEDAAIAPASSWYDANFQTENM